MCRVFALLLTTLAVVGCGGSDSPSAGPEPSDSSVQMPSSGLPSGLVSSLDVDESDSPLPDTRGVIVHISEGTRLTLLSGIASETAAADLQVIAEPNLSGADMSAALGEAFLRFEDVSSAEVSLQVVLQTEEALAGILACNIDSNECELVLTGTLPDGSLVFDADPNLHYAFEKVAP